MTPSNSPFRWIHLLGTLTAILVAFGLGSTSVDASPDERDANASAESDGDPRLTLHSKPSPRADGANAEPWPCIYGPRRDGTTLETRLLRDWPKSGPKLLWEVSIGDGYASPVAAGENLLFTHLDGKEAVVECRHPETGKLRWEFRFESDFDGEIIRDDGPRASPVIDGDRVFVHGTEGKLFALSLAKGEVLWQRDLDEEFQLPESFFGVCSTPLVWQDKLIVNVGAPGRGPCMLALDPATGETLWNMAGIGGASCSSPIAVEYGGRPWVFVLSGGQSRPPVGALIGLDPRNGQKDIEVPFRSRTYYSVNACMPLFVDGRIFIMADKGMGCGLVRIVDETPDDPTPEQTGENAPKAGTFAWRNLDVGLEFVATVHRDGRLFVFDGENRVRPGLVCLDSKTGEEIWRQKITLDDGARPGQASILLADGDALALGDGGSLFWMRLGDDGVEILSQARLFDARETWTPPVVHDGILFIRQNAIDETTGKGPRVLAYDLRARN